MSTTTSSPSAATSACTNMYQLPVKDVACAVVTTKGNYSDIMDKCCDSAPVKHYNHDCGLYCLAIDKNVGNLTHCMTKNGVQGNELFCSTSNQTAKATSSPSATNTGASSTSSSTSTSTDSSATSTGTSGANALAQPVSKSGLGVSGLGVLGLVFCSALLGVVA